jgi:hypothetical protein
MEERRRLSMEAEIWRPRVGAPCLYTLSTEERGVRNAPARIAVVRPDWVLDLDVQIEGRVERRCRVDMSRSELVPNTWRLA